MKLYRYIGCVYNLYYEEIMIKFRVHKSLINEGTRDMILIYLVSGFVPEEIHVIMSENVMCFEPIVCKDKQFEKENTEYLWFVL